MERIRTVSDRRRRVSGGGIAGCERNKLASHELTEVASVPQRHSGFKPVAVPASFPARALAFCQAHCFPPESRADLFENRSRGLIHKTLVRCGTAKVLGRLRNASLDTYQSNHADERPAKTVERDLAYGSVRQRTKEYSFRSLFQDDIPPALKSDLHCACRFDCCFCRRVDGCPGIHPRADRVPIGADCRSTGTVRENQSTRHGSFRFDRANLLRRRLAGQRQRLEAEVYKRSAATGQELVGRALPKQEIAGPWRLAAAAATDPRGGPGATPQ